MYIGNRPPGCYWLGAKADASSQVNETNEANNYLSGAPIDFNNVYGSDSAMTAIGGPAGGAAGQAVRLTNAVVNYGPEPASGFYIGFYPCPTPAIGTNGYLIGVRYLFQPRHGRRVVRDQRARPADRRAAGRVLPGRRGGPPTPAPSRTRPTACWRTRSRWPARTGW